tara:strand:+ start:162 stop:527 length:366 start_codon:yes stop_codon:yes gene_type:complete
MRIPYAAPAGEPRYNIDAGALNAELTTALGVPPGVLWNASHNAHEAIVDIEDASKEATVRVVVEAHIANTEKREANKVIDAQIAALEKSVTERMKREAALGDKARLSAVDAQIATLRGQRQ